LLLLLLLLWLLKARILQLGRVGISRRALIGAAI